ncbi:PA2169 family four-helix-bundle protein [Terrimonas sp. NA20]|uniref:PA2169 family four-helix-bundle protein n=1 Tax=Terrimonas ginsenosidimutans TaxID=2908004 RepID=A0ABS9KLW1_9BACT|nr:PA2169 family four-helix-bundle protein [Terrimonas ginsenosidimutans]MCG2613314.1 PA2169 family four-helix-bundle protein [Terrimonas ginsenosidimutans]
MATMTETRNSVLNDLIEINNDRIAGFEKVLADIKDENVDLKALFQEYATQSRKFSQELTALVAASAGDPETDNSFAGTLHRAWIDVKSLFGGSDRKSILAEAERGEDAIKKAYTTALTDGSLSGEALSLVTAQSADIKSAHDKIKALRDSAI